MLEGAATLFNKQQLWGLLLRCPVWWVGAAGCIAWSGSPPQLVLTQGMQLRPVKQLLREGMIREPFGTQICPARTR